MYMIYLLIFKAFNNMSLLTLNSLFVIKSGPYSIRYINNYVGTICKSNTRSLNVIINILNSWKTLSKHVKFISSYLSFNVFTEAMLLE